VRSSRDLSALGYRRIVLALLTLLLVPTVLMLAVGVILLFLGEAKVNILMGILVLALSGAAATGVTLVWVFVRREANLSQLQSDFVSKVSHELRTPLTSIRLFTETLALRRADPEATKKCIDGLERETTRLQDLIDRLLDWGRMESGRRGFDVRPADVHSIVADALRAVEPLRERVSASIEKSVPEKLPQVWAEHAAMVDVLVNLLTNACKYGGSPAQIRLEVGTAGQRLRIAVQDQGPGIPIAEHKRIFQKFYRVDDRLSRSQEGSGLGLAIVHHVMKAHKGHVDVKSAPGHGSTFTLSIPVVEDAVAG
jgi:two-component system, OmpR family, phosphate regulon sensor histidine kinase PhoR